MSMSGIYSSLTGPRSLIAVRGGTAKISKGKDNSSGDKQQALEKEKKEGKEEEVEGEGSDAWDGVIRRVVIGVPANCSEKKKEATRRAARSAGFEEVAAQYEGWWKLLIHTLTCTAHKICTPCVCYSYCVYSYVCYCICHRAW